MDIWWYIAQDNPSNADKFFDRIQDSCLTLVGFPQMGAKRDELTAVLMSVSHALEYKPRFVLHQLNLMLLTCSKNAVR